MGRTIQQALPGVEGNRVEIPDRPDLNKVAGLKAGELQMAKVGFGAAVGHAIADTPDKSFGEKSWISNIKSGRAVPEYLARIYADRHARRRFALALLKDDEQVRVRMLIECDWDEEGKCHR